MCVCVCVCVCVSVSVDCVGSNWLCGATGFLIFRGKLVLSLVLLRESLCLVNKI